MAKCLTPVLGDVLRVTPVDECGRPDVEAACQFVVTDGYVSVALSANTDAGSDIIVRNARNDLCVFRPARELLTSLGVSIEFCAWDFDLLHMTTHSRLVEDWDGQTNGIEILAGAGGDYALEVWTGLEGVECPEDPEDGTPAGYILLPWVQAGAMGDLNVSNSEIPFTVNGVTRAGSAWGEGPYDVEAQDAANTPGPLVQAYGTDAHARIQETTVAPPMPACGCQPVS